MGKLRYNMKPNIFDYATSELSQDAFLAWLFKWAEKDNEQYDKQLHDCAEDCLRKFLGKINPKEIKSVEIYKQWENIDLWITVNNIYHLIIEDKTGTSEHDNQLLRYKKTAKDWYVSEKGKCFENRFAFVYYKSGDITPYERDRVSETSYQLIERTELLSILEQYKINNSFFNDYKEKLQNIQTVQNTIFTKRFDEILKMDIEDKNECLKGFYTNIYPELEDAYWDYVNNPSRPFYGMWWYWCSWTYGTLYFQFNEFDLQIRLNEIKRTKDFKIARNKTYDKLMEAVENNKEYKGKITKPERFGVGNSMTIAVVDQSAWLSLDKTGCLDKDGVLKKLHKLEKFLWHDVLGNE